MQFPCTTFWRRIEDCALNRYTHDPSPPFSRAKLKVLCSEVHIREVLDCTCDACCDWLKTRKFSLSSESTTKLILGHQDRPSSVITFCLLTYTYCPQLIRWFVEHADPIYDDVFQRTAKDHHIEPRLEALWTEYKFESNPAHSSHLRDILRSRRQFFVPSIESTSKIDEFNKSDILPFFDEQPVHRSNNEGEIEQEQGAFGRVFSFRIFPEYDGLSQSPGQDIFVRKELFRASTKLFDLERDNLELIKKLKHPHLVQLLKAYKHGDKFNFIFPKAETNLDSYLRQSRFNAPFLPHLPIESNPIWKQALGITKALAKVINLKLPDGKLYYGYHMDLKPANILVESNGTLLITDFGQARFKLNDGMSQVTHLGGTESYAPPEYATVEQKSRKYDVWSLGCLLLEIYAFVIGGHEFVKDLDHTRVTQNLNGEDDRFFASSDGGSCTLKQEISSWMQKTEQSDRLGSKASQTFAFAVLDLIRRMLEPSSFKRVTIGDAERALEKILDCRDRPSAEDDTLSLADGDAEYAKFITSNISSMMYLHQGRWKQATFKITEDDTHTIHLSVKSGTETDRLRLGTKDYLKVLPRYASHFNAQEGAPVSHILFSTAEYKYSDEFARTQLRFDHTYDASRVHSALIGQDILFSESLVQCVFRRSSKLARIFSGHESEPKCGSARRIELWSENSSLHPSSQRKNGSLRRFSTNGIEPAPRRIVIYFENEILLIRCSYEIKLERPQIGNNQFRARIVPDSSAFIISFLKPGKCETEAGIPVSHDHLEMEEMKHTHKCKYVEFAFESRKKLVAFTKSYLALKDSWSADQEIIDRCPNLGEQMGYAVS